MFSVYYKEVVLWQKLNQAKAVFKIKKIVPVKPYKKADGTTVKGHRRSTPN